MINFLIQNAGWFAYLAALASVISAAALFIFFARGGIFGPINDGASSIQMLFLIPVALGEYEILRHSYTSLALVVALAGIISMISISILQGATVFRRVRYEKTLSNVLGMGAVLGGWWLINGWLSLATEMFPATFSWLGVVCGVSALLLVVGLKYGGRDHPLAVISFLTNALSVPIWTFWMGNILRA